MVEILEAEIKKQGREIKTIMKKEIRAENGAIQMSVLAVKAAETEVGDEEAAKTKAPKEVTTTEAWAVELDIEITQERQEEEDKNSLMMRMVVTNID